MVQVERCSHCLLVLGAVETALTINNCDSITVVTACRRLHVRLEMWEGLGEECERCGVGRGGSMCMCVCLGGRGRLWKYSVIPRPPPNLISTGMRYDLIRGPVMRLVKCIFGGGETKCMWGGGEGRNQEGGETKCLLG